MATKKKSTKAPRSTKKAKKKTPRKTQSKSTTGAGKPPREKPPSPSSSTAPRPPLHPAVALIVSLLAPGLGLLLLEEKDRVKDAFLVFGLWFCYVALSFFLSFFVIGLCCWLPLPLLNLAAGIHSFDEMTLEQGGQPLLFQTSFRIFRDEPGQPQ